MMSPWTLEALVFAWGDAYQLSYDRDWWVARRRDGQAEITACTLDLLEQAIQDNYRRRPVPRIYDPPGADAYLDGPENDGTWWGDTGEERPGDNCRTDRRTGPEQAEPGPDVSLVLAELRQLFPLWQVTYCAELGTWRATSRYGSFCEPSIALVWVGLTRLERKVD
jgi:hypothetical protein